jgi:hypothetical protein
MGIFINFLKIYIFVVSTKNNAKFTRDIKHIFITNNSIFASFEQVPPYLGF